MPHADVDKKQHYTDKNVCHADTDCHTETQTDSINTSCKLRQQYTKVCLTQTQTDTEIMRHGHRCMHLAQTWLNTAPHTGMAKHSAFHTDMAKHSAPHTDMANHSAPYTHMAKHSAPHTDTSPHPKSAAEAPKSGSCWSKPEQVLASRSSPSQNL